MEGREMFVHGDNLAQKEKQTSKYNSRNEMKLLKEIRKRYDLWKKDNLKLKGPFIIPSTSDSKIISQRVNLFSRYKNFIDQQKYAEAFDSRSNLHSTVLEEFIYYLFRDMVLEFSQSALIGKGNTFKDIFFNAPNYRSMMIYPNAQIEEKDHDFVIGVNIETRMKCAGSEEIQEKSLQIPAIAIECKTYLDKTMLEGSSTSAEQLKMKNPNAIYLVVAEWLKLTEQVNLKKFKVDQVYILRKQKNTDREFRFLPDYRKKPVYEDVVLHLFKTVRNHLTADWEGGIAYGLKRGYLI